MINYNNIMGHTFNLGVLCIFGFIVYVDRTLCCCCGSGDNYHFSLSSVTKLYHYKVCVHMRMLYLAMVE